MSHSNNLKDELNKFAPELSRMNKREGFQVPPRYFDRLGEEVIRKMNATNAEKAEAEQPLFSLIVDFLQSLIKPRFAIGLATIALLFIGVRHFISDSANNMETFVFESLADEEFDSYLAEHLYDFEDELLFDLVNEGLYFPETIADEDLDDYFEEINEDLDFGTLEEIL